MESLNVGSNQSAIAEVCGESDTKKPDKRSGCRDINVIDAC